MRFLILIFAFLIGSQAFSQSHKWHGTNQDARYPDTDLMDKWPNDSLTLIQTYSGIGEGYGSPSLREDGLYIAGMHDSIGYVYKFSHDGEMMWKTMYGLDYTNRYRGSRGTPTLEGNRLYYSGALGDVLCLDTSTGEKIWHVNIFDKYEGGLIKWGYTESVVIYKDLVILQPGGKKVSLCGLDKYTGKTVWETSLPGNKNAYCTPKLIDHNGETLCMLNMSYALLIFEPETGKIRLKHILDNSRENHSNENIYQDGQIFYSSGYGEGSVMYNWNTSENRLDTLWQNTAFDSKLSGIQVVDGLIYGTADNKKHWAVLRWDTGEQLFSTRDIKPGALVMADGKFYIFTDDAEVVLATPHSEGFDIVSRFKTPAHPARHAYSHPVIYKGDLLVRFNNDIWRYRIRN